MRSPSICGRLTAVLLVTATLAALACSGSSPARSAEPITIGAIVPVSALALNYYVSAYRAAVRSINAHGGIKGRQVRIDICDDRNDPNQAQACARRMVSQHVIASAASISGLSMVEGPILDEAGIPQVMGEALNPEDFTLPTAFPLDGGIFVQFAGGLVGMKRRNLHSLHIVTADSPSGRTLVQLAGGLMKAADINLSGASYIPMAATDFTPYVQAAMQSKADVVFPGLAPAMTIPFMIASKRAGARYLIMVPYGEFTPQDIEHMGGRDAITENSIEFSATPPLSATDRFAALRQFSDDMDAQLAAGDPGAAPDRRTGGSLMAWLSVQVIAREAASLDTVDSAHLLEAFRTRPTIDTLGLTPPWSPGRPGLPTFPRVTNLYGYLSSQRNGVEVLVDPAPFNPLQSLRLFG